MPSSRVDYDAIAELYDSQPYREKSPDPELTAFIASRAPTETLAVLDIACGTGNQLVADRAVVPDAFMTGVDGSFGMLRQARRKSADIAWVQADSAALPFPDASFDFVGCQYAFHHFRDKAGMIREALRVLRPGGRFVTYNVCPHECRDWLYYTYFPEMLARDLADFWPPDAIVAEMSGAGFASPRAEPRHLHFDHDLGDLLAEVKRRDSNSQLMTLPDEAYAAGLARLERDVTERSAPPVRADHLCFLTICGDKPAMMDRPNRGRKP